MLRLLVLWGGVNSACGPNILRVPPTVSLLQLIIYKRRKISHHYTSRFFGIHGLCGNLCESAPGCNSI